MPRYFSAKDAKSLSEAASQRLSQMDVVAQQRKVTTDMIKNAAGDLIKSGALQRDISAVLRGGESRSDEIAAKLAEAVYVFRCTAGYSREAEDLLKKERQNIIAAMRLLAPAGSAWQWFLTSSAKKQAAEGAYSYLSELMENDFGRRTKQMIEQMRTDLKDTAAAARREFPAEKEEYRNTVARVCPSALRMTAAVPEITGLIAEHGELLKLTEDALMKTAARKNAVTAAVDRLLTKEALKVLEDASVDEINKAYGGIRVKTLHDAGYHTIADISRTSVNKLAYIKGISEEKAHLLKQIAAGYVEEIRKNVKIRLSSDDRSREATDLVAAIYGYKLRLGEYRTLLKISTICKEQIERQRNTLLHAVTGVNWVFLNDQQKRETAAARSDLAKLSAGQYPEMVRSLSGSLLANIAPDPKTVWTDFEAGPIAYYTTLEDICPGILGNDDALYGLPEDLAHAVAEEEVLKDGLKCTLRRYQEWGVKYALHQKRVLLGDEMGLGKTIQAIAVMVSLRNSGLNRFMVVCPASVLTNWCREIEKHSDLPVTKVHGSCRAKALAEWKESGGAAVTTYETAEFLKKEDFPIDMIVVDEAHYIKNPEAQRSINVNLLCMRAKYLLFMTGTALENRVDEMVSLMRVLRPEIAEEAGSKTFMSAAPQFRGLIAPVYYRRRREDVLTELPELEEVQEWCELGDKERVVYMKSVLLRNFADVRRVSWNAEDPADSCKAKRMLELIEEAASEGRKIIVFSFFLNTIRRVKDMLGDRAYGPINGSVPPLRRQQIIDEFDAAPAGSVLAAQIQSGGTGLNIQSASVVIICEPQFKPSTENQAISRAYRMGQARNVLVYRLLAENTVDEHIMDILESKQAVFEAFADISAAADLSREIDDSTFAEIIDEETAKIRGEAVKYLPAGTEVTEETSSVEIAGLLTADDL